MISSKLFLTQNALNLVSSFEISRRFVIFQMLFSHDCIFHLNMNRRVEICKIVISSQQMSSEWCTIESDPGVFTSLIESFGVKNAELSELWSLDDDSLSNLGKVYGLVFLFKWQRDDSDDVTAALSPLTGEDVPTNLFFARQTTTNACATQAILSILLNAVTEENKEEEDELKLGPILSNFKSFTASFAPDLRGEGMLFIFFS